jgi:hypothetical protein
MTQPTGKTYIPTGALKVRETCAFVTKHQGALLAAVTLLDPTQVAAATSAIAAIQSACALFEHIEELYDPYFGKNTARAEP